jgi:hypothetical protein
MLTTASLSAAEIAAMQVQLCVPAFELPVMRMFAVEMATAMHDTVMLQPLG